MEHTVRQLFWSQSGEKQAGNCPADDETEANKQRRKLQNRQNQRAHRRRLKEKDARTVQKSRLFKVRRWRLDELNDCSIPKKPLASESTVTSRVSPQLSSPYTGISSSPIERSLVLRVEPPASRIHPLPNPSPRPFTFPLSSDHLLHLIQYNVLRALVSNKRSLNILPSDITGCPLTGPCQDEATLYPLNPINSSFPPSLMPTTLQQTRDHSTWIDLIPFPRIRDNLIRCEGRYDHRELMQDLIGEFMGATSPPWHRGMITIASNLKTRGSLILSTGTDTDEVTAGRQGLIVWGEPHEIQSWEATPDFIAKWTWAVEGCEELINISNYWRMKRGEEPMRLSVLRSYPPPLLAHATLDGTQVLI